MLVSLSCLHMLLVGRWERSRNVTHYTCSGPLNHIWDAPDVIARAPDVVIAYGIVARSIPLHRQVLSGYLDASGVRAGLGIGNPNAEFTPNVTSCAMSSDGGTAKIVWGSKSWPSYLYSRATGHGDKQAKRSRH